MSVLDRVSSRAVGARSEAGRGGARRFSIPAAALGALALAAAALRAPPPAEACGGFFRRQNVKTNLPALEVEQVLVVFDRAKGKEHFVREVTFKDGNDTFGFVVPVPSKPDVASVKSRPWGKLATKFPLFPPTDDGAGTKGGGKPGGARGKPEGGGVVVHEVKEVGSFKAFVLSATDAKALSGWLEENKLETNPENDAWLAHYVKAGFFFVAFRHDPPKEKKDDAGGVTSETIRLSFATAAPYYPYREPEHAATPDRDRVLAVWLVSNDERAPLAVEEKDGKRRWVRPWLEGSRTYPVPIAELKGLSEDLEGLWPAPREGSDTLLVQVFEDQKASRKGFGDVLLVPKKPLPLGEQKESAKALLHVLEPALLGGAK